MTEPSVTGTDRPSDVDTAFWLWLIALPLLVAGYISEAVTRSQSLPVVVAFTVVFAVLLAAVVLTFLLLLRGGYRWVRTVLVAGALATIVYTVSSLFTVPRDTVPALIYAGTGIIGMVLLAGGIFLVHRKDADAFFTR